MYLKSGGTLTDPGPVSDVLQVMINSQGLLYSVVLLLGSVALTVSTG